jgi:Ca-activated chloride channel family protein
MDNGNATAEDVDLDVSGGVSVTEQLEFGEHRTIEVQEGDWTFTFSEAQASDGVGSGSDDQTGDDEAGGGEGEAGDEQEVQVTLEGGTSYNGFAMGFLQEQMMDGGIAGEDGTGGDTAGEDEETAGGDQTGGDETGGDETGGDETGGDQTGGDETDDGTVGQDGQDQSFQFVLVENAMDVGQAGVQQPGSEQLSISSLLSSIW